jgi:DNA excision repair protein ERCC-2
MRVMHVVAENPVSFLQHLKDVTFIERKPLRFCAERLTSLVRTLELTDLEHYSSLQRIAAFATLVATYDKGNTHTTILYAVFNVSNFMNLIGFLLILEPFESDMATIPNPVLHFT